MRQKHKLIIGMIIFTLQHSVNAFMKDFLYFIKQSSGIVLEGHPKLFLFWMLAAFCYIFSQDDLTLLQCRGPGSGEISLLIEAAVI